MIYTIENEIIKVDVSDMGAELQSIVLKSDNTEYLWQGNPEFWAGRASNLFPICGRLTDGKYTYKGKTYEMNLHGFARHSVFSAEKLSDTELKFTLTSSDELKVQYPFDFIFSITYTLDGNGLNCRYDVKNTGAEVMYFGLGGHPGYNVPLTEGEKFEDYYLEFDCVKPIKLVCMSPLFYLGKTEPYPLTDGKIIELDHSLFSEDARFFTDMCGYVTLKSKKSEKFVRMEYPNMKFLGIWHKPQTTAPYICIEPWTSLPAYDGKVDNLETKNEMTVLGAGESYNNGFKVIIG